MGAPQMTLRTHEEIRRVYLYKNVTQLYLTI
jgi:hypothetical protein